MHVSTRVQTLSLKCRRVQLSLQTFLLLSSKKTALLQVHSPAAYRGTGCHGESRVFMKRQQVIWVIGHICVIWAVNRLLKHLIWYTTTDLHTRITTTYQQGTLSEETHRFTMNGCETEDRTSFSLITCCICLCFTTAAMFITFKAKYWLEGTSWTSITLPNIPLPRNPYKGRTSPSDYS